MGVFLAVYVCRRADVVAPFHCTARPHAALPQIGRNASTVVADYRTPLRILLLITYGKKVLFACHVSRDNCFIHTVRLSTCPVKSLEGEQSEVSAIGIHWQSPFPEVPI